MAASTTAQRRIEDPWREVSWDEAFSFAAARMRGDPFGYLAFAREGRGFFDAHVREPVFVESARVFLWLAGDRDIGLNLASAFYGTLQTIEQMQLKAIEIPTCPRKRVSIEALRLALDRWKIKACLIVPNFSNPTGAVMPALRLTTASSSICSTSSIVMPISLKILIACRPRKRWRKR